MCSASYSDPTVVKVDSTIAVIDWTLFEAIVAIIWKPGLSKTSSVIIVFSPEDSTCQGGRPSTTAIYKRANSHIQISSVDKLNILDLCQAPN